MCSWKNEKIGLDKYCSIFIVYINHLGIFFDQGYYNSADLMCCCLRFCISNTLPGDVNAGHPWTTLNNKALDN